MKPNMVAIGAFVFTALLLFSIGLFMVGNRNKVFARHVDFYTELRDVNGILPGTKIRVSGFDAGQVSKMEIPSSPSGPFRIELHVDAKLRSLIRSDSSVSVESDGLVGDKFLMIAEGTDHSPEATPDATLPSKEPVELSEIESKVTGIMDEANTTIVDLRGKLDGTLTAIHSTVNNADSMVTNANGMVSDARHGKGTIGTLLNDQQTAQRIKDAIANTQQASANLNQASLHVDQVVTDLQQRNLGQKAEDTLNNAKDASRQLDETSRQVNSTITEALAPDHSGTDAGVNLRETLSNVNLATANIADDTEALKHEFFFRGFFKKRGYYSLKELSPDQYRGNAYFGNPANRRSWLGPVAFTKDPSGNEDLSEVGEMQIDQILGELKGSVVNRPMVIEGYSDRDAASDEMIMSRTRAILIARYVEKRYHLSASNVGIMPLEATPPSSTGKTSWDGACIVFPAEGKR